MVEETVYHLDGTVEIRQVPDSSAAYLSILKDYARNRLADLRWNKSQTLTYDGVVAPADGAMAALTGVVVAVRAGLIQPDATITWKLADNEFRDWSAQELLAYGAAVQAHIQACFVREAAFTALIDAATDEEALEAIDFEEGWPS